MVYIPVNESQNGVEMDNELLKWLGSVITSSAVVGLATYLMRNTLSRIFSRSVEHHFEKKFESFKADLKDKEKELERISAFLLSARRERDAALQSKRFEAAETIMRSRQLLSGLTLITEYLKYLNIDEIMKKGDDPKITGFIDTLMSPLNVDEQIKTYNAIDRTSPRLYLSEQTLKIFEAYEGIILYAVMTMKILSLPLKKKAELFKKGRLSEQIIELIPSSRDTFEEYGEGYALFWVSYFYDETLKALRKELLEDANLAKDTESATRLAIDSRQAQYNLHALLQQRGLPDTLINTNSEKVQG